MNLYLTNTGRYVGTQVEAKASGLGWTPEEVPVDKQGLIDYLNTLSEKQPHASDNDELIQELHSKIERLTNAIPVPVVAGDSGPLNQAAVEKYIEVAPPLQLSAILMVAVDRLHHLKKDVGL